MELIDMLPHIQLFPLLRSRFTSCFNLLVTASFTSGGGLAPDLITEDNVSRGNVGLCSSLLSRVLMLSPVIAHCAVPFHSRVQISYLAQVSVFPLCNYLYYQ